MSRDRQVVEKVVESLRNIGQFELSPLRESEAGGCYKAVDLGRRIAVSIRTVWPEECPEDTEYLAKVLAQARAAQALTHGNLGKVIGSGELDGALFIVSAFVDGHTLRQNLRSGDHLSVWDLIDFARQTCTGLETAHARGMVHHALHPDNVALEFDGTTRLLDIGLYRRNLAGTDPFHANAVYLAPEQLAGGTADPATNFYSVAVMLYEIATGGTLPFRGDSWETLRANAEGELVAPIQIAPQLPAGINAVLVKALSRERAARFQSGPELVRALEDYKSFGKPAVVVVAPAPVVRPNPVTLEAAAVAPAPVRTSFAAPQIETMPVQRADFGSQVSAEKPQLVDTLEMPQQTWKRPVETPKPVPVAVAAEVVDPGLALPEQTGPTRQEIAKELAKEIADRAVHHTQKQIKKVNPWIAALVVLGILLVGFIGRTIAMSFWGTPKVEGYQADQAPAPTPVAETSNVQPVAAPVVAAPVAAAPETPAPEQEVIVRKNGVVVHGAAAKNAHKRMAAVGPSVFNAAHPLTGDGASSTTGSVAITTDPAGAKIVVDGRANAVFTSPQVIASLSPGVHTLTITKDGYSAATRPVEITAGAQSHLEVKLDAPSGSLAVMSTPSGAYILVDGVSTGRQTPAQVAVAPGPHTLTLRKLGYLESNNSFTIRSGEQASRTVGLLESGSTPDIKVAQTTGMRKMFGGNKVPGVRVTVHTTPAGATVTINGQEVPKLSPVEFGLNPGNYVMEIHMPGYQTLRKTISVVSGQPLVLEEALQQ